MQSDCIQCNLYVDWFRCLCGITLYLVSVLWNVEDSVFVTWSSCIFCRSTLQPYFLKTGFFKAEPVLPEMFKLFVCLRWNGFCVTKNNCLKHPARPRFFITLTIWYMLATSRQTNKQSKFKMTMIHLGFIRYCRLIPMTLDVFHCFKFKPNLCTIFRHIVSTKGD